MTVANDDIEETDTITTVDDQADTDDTYTYVSDDSVAVDNSAIAPLPTTPAKVVTDTVRPGRFLATMARRHYGNYKFWVYIYLENRDKIPNPDNLPAGTVLVIPPAEKYGIDASDPASVSRAEAAIRHIEKR
jgi:nucleoid-associated protein YgaU